MKRRLFSILSVLSLLLFVAVCALWIRSLVRQDVLTLQAAHRWSIESGGGELRLRWEHVGSHPAPRLEYDHRQPNSLRWILNNQHHEKRQFRLLGFGYGEFRETMAPSWQGPPRPMIPLWSVRLWAVPYWFLFLATAVAPASRAWNNRTRPSLPRPGLCPSCNYDLRATPDRCPECGNAPTKS